MPELKSMKIEYKPEDAAPKEILYPTEKPEYPWGLEINLQDEQLKALGMTQLPEIKSEMMITAKVRVTRVSANENIDGESRCLTLQITDLGIGS